MNPKFPGDNSSHQYHERILPSGHLEAIHYHKLRTEVWVILSGEAIVTLEGMEFPVEAGSSVTIPRFHRHGLRVNGVGPCELLEIWIYPRAAEENLKDDHISMEAKINDG